MNLRHYNTLGNCQPKAIEGIVHSFSNKGAVINRRSCLRCNRQPQLMGPLDGNIQINWRLKQLEPKVLAGKPKSEGTQGNPVLNGGGQCFLNA
jgi:hypothetical protein